MAATRPDLEDVIDGAELRRWYWLKEELTERCRAVGLSAAGSKAELTNRLAHFLDTGEKLRPGGRRTPPPQGFDWRKGSISPATVIDEGYANGPNVRAFFIAQIGKRFRFNIAFMKWMRDASGRTMADAIEAWLSIEADRKAGVRSEIPASNQYNRYMRDFFEVNPDRSVDDARKCWLSKRRRPGHNLYEDGDLSALEDF